MSQIIRLSLLICSLICISVPLQAQKIISGDATITLTGPATKEVTLRAETEALKNLRAELLHWIREDVELSIDTANAVQRKSFSMFVDSCRKIAKSETSFKGKNLTLTYLLTEEQAQQKLEHYNTMVDTRALNGWKRLQSASSEDDYKAVFNIGISTLFYAMAHLGPPVANPEVEGRDLADDIRRVLQKLFDRIHVSSSGMILEGKTGLAIENPPTITVLFDSIPFSGITFAGSLQNGTIMFSLPTNEKGQIPVNTFKIPFVPNGTLLEAFPNVAPQLGITGFVNPTHFGLRLNGQVQSFMFKISKASYILTYNATSASTVAMPPEFSKEALVNTFLKDSCYLTPGTASETDLAITINTQVSSYSYDATEEIGIKFTSQIIVVGNLLDPVRTNKQQFVFEKRYGRYTTPPYGLFFWEATGKLREAIRTTIGGL